MKENELIELLAATVESNRGKYVPWWDFDYEKCMYRYELFTEEEIKSVTEWAGQCTQEALLTTAGSMGFTVFHLLVWANFYDAVENILPKIPDINVPVSQGKGSLENTCTGATPLMLSCYRGNFKMAELLTAHGADGAVRDEAGRNAYHYLACPHIKNLVNPFFCMRDNVMQREAVAGLLPDGMINVRDESGLTPLERMLGHDNANVSCALSGVLLDKGADTAGTDEEGNSLLMTAIRKNHMTAAMKLMEKRELVNRKNNEGKTPLHLAAERSSTELCMALLEKGADKTVPDASGRTPKDIVLGGYNMELKQFFDTGRMKLDTLSRLTANAFAGYSPEERDRLAPALYLAGRLVREVDTDDDEELSLVLSILYNALLYDENCQVLDIIKDAGIDFTSPVHRGGSVECIRDCCLSGNYGVKVIRKFLELGVDMDEPLIKGRTPANIVASLKERRMLFGGKDDYCEKAADFFSRESMEYVDDKGTTAMHEAARNDHGEMLRVMIKKGADVNLVQDAPADAGATPLHIACEYGRVNTARLLMESGAEDTLQNNNGETPAHLAVMKKRFGGDLSAQERIGVLQALNNVDIARNDGKTPLMLLQYLDINTVMEVMPVLLDKGADVNHADNAGNTALLAATQNQCYKGIVKELVRAGADVNGADKNGRTPLHFALRYGDQESARFLIKKGADYNRCDNTGVTPAQIAAEKGYDTVLELMTDIR